MDDQRRENPGSVIVEGSVALSSVPRERAEPAFEDGLNERQRAFVDFYVGGIAAQIAGTEEDVPPGDGTRSAIAAGYGAGAGNMATRNLLKPKVQAEIERRIKVGRGSALLVGVTALFKVLDKGTDERAIVTAATAILDRFGMAPPKGPAVAVQINNLGANEAQAILIDVQERRQQRLARQADTSDA